MKYGLIVLIMAVFGIGEYAFVEYYPLQPHQRVTKFQKLPIVKQIVLHQEEELVRKAIEGSEDGSLPISYGGDRISWTSVEEWRQARKKGDQAANWAVRHLRDIKQAKSNLPRMIEQAAGGDPSAAAQIFWTAKMLGDAELKEKAVSLLRDHPTAIGKFYYQLFTSAPDSSKNGVDSALMHTRVAIENWRSPFASDAQFKLQTAQNANSITLLQQNAASGNEDTVWIVEQLKAEGLLD